MEKILSIIIPTYNMEALLPRCLDSLLINQNFEALDILVVNDGSTDRSSEIGHKYESHYPGVIRVLDKPNGNYGSCINAGLKVAVGKYVKVLDSDDFFATNQLEKLVASMLVYDADVVYSDFTVLYDTRTDLRKSLVSDISDKILSLDTFPIPAALVSMHAMAYRTELLRTIGYVQTEGISYTDQEWIFFPMFYAKTMVYLPYNVYQYVMGRVGQTMDPEMLLRSYSHTLKGVLRMMEYYRQFDKSKLSSYVRSYLSDRIEGRCAYLYRMFIVTMTEDNYDDVSCCRLDEALYRCDIEIYKKLGKMKLHRFFPVRFVARWRKGRKRITNSYLKKLSI